MPKRLSVTLAVFFMAALISGCSASKEVKWRAFVEDKPRVDQEVQGNVGNWDNSPDAVSSQQKPTRKIYTMEVSKEPAESSASAEKIIEDARAKAKSQMQDKESQMTEDQFEVGSTEQDLDIPSFDEDTQTQSEESFHSLSEDTTYTVKKDDTLQKIAKQFYGSYGKWTKIYDANKDVIPDPNRIKPGIVIQIPKE